MPGMKKKMKGGVAAGAAPAANSVEGLKSRAAEFAGRLKAKWEELRKTDINTIKSMFDENGNVNMDGEHAAKLMSATFFSDLYKWTMTPVIRELESMHGNITVTFGIDLRDPKMIEMLHASLNPEKKEALPDSLITKINAALQTLTQRTFNRDVFDHVLNKTGKIPVGGLAPPGDRTKIFEEGTLDAICGIDGTPNKLADEVIPFLVKSLDDEELEMTSDASVRVRFYFDATKIDKYGREGVFFVEATGPWHRVTWLETSMMQCVYEATLRHELDTQEPLVGGANTPNLGKFFGNKNKNNASMFEQPTRYMQWLDKALMRCAKSICFSYLVQQQNNGAPPPGKPFPALFTGRRTGGRLFILLQNLMIGDMFNGPAGTPLPNSRLSEFETVLPPGEKQKCLGSSSCDSHFILTKLNLPCSPPIGTNAHEKRMVASIMYAHLDQNIQGLPLSQMIVEYLYYTHVWKKTGGLAPTLPDTVGSIPFMKTAEMVTFGPGLKADNPNPTFLQLIGLPRQDSGKLPDFLKIMTDFGYKGPSMASEIDSANTLFEAAKLKYLAYGAGGFFGDSEKVWDPSRDNKLSMAVKPVRVVFKSFVPNELLTGIPYIKIIKDGLVLGYPVKLGDASDPAKVSIDRNIDPAEVTKIIAFCIQRKIATDADPVRFKTTPINISKLLDKALIGALPKEESLPAYVTGSGYPPWKMFDVVHLAKSANMDGGRRRRHRTQKKRRTNRKKTAKRGKSRKH